MKDAKEGGCKPTGQANSKPHRGIYRYGGKVWRSAHLAVGHTEMAVRFKQIESKLARPLINYL